MDARTRNERSRRTLISMCGLVAVSVAGFKSASSAEIPSQIDYSTSGWVSMPGGQSPLYFIGIQSGKTAGSEPFDLGNFRVNSLPGVTTTYDHTPFAITFSAPAYNRVVPGDVPTNFTVYQGSFMVWGYIDGTIFADGHSQLVATFSTDATGDISERPATGVYLYGLPFPISDIKIPLSLDLSQAANESGYDEGRFAVNVTIVPEPGSVAIFMVGIAAVALKARHLRGRRAETPVTNGQPI